MHRKPDTEHCRLCLRSAQLTFHHLIPRKVHRRPRFKKHYSPEQLQAGIWVCSPCHKAIHKFHSEMELALNLNTAERLLQDASVQRHVRWVRKQKIRLS
ncbi:MAG: hypothetical protein ACX931_10080 [Saccharospirillum sp.]